MPPSVSAELYWWGDELVRGSLPPRLDESHVVELKLPSPFSESLKEMLSRAGWRMVEDERARDGTEYVRFRHEQPVRA